MTCRRSVTRLEEAYAALERHLDGREYLVGEHFTIADVVIGTRGLHRPPARPASHLAEPGPPTSLGSTSARPSRPPTSGELSR